MKPKRMGGENFNIRKLSTTKIFVELRNFSVDFITWEARGHNFMTSSKNDQFCDSPTPFRIYFINVWSLEMYTIHVKIHVPNLTLDFLLGAEKIWQFYEFLLISQRLIFEIAFLALTIITIIIIIIIIKLRNTKPKDTNNKYY